MALHYISYRIVNGESISLWFDPWWRHTCLAHNMYSPIIRQCGLEVDAKVSKLINTRTWCLPTPNQRHHHVDTNLLQWLETFDYPAFNLNSSDAILWDGLELRKVKPWHIWESTRNRGPGVPWSKAIWHTLKIIRYAHHSWLLCHGKLLTLARMARFGMIVSQQSYLCIGGRETDSHLFIRCRLVIHGCSSKILLTYGSYMLSKIRSRLGILAAGNTWLQLLQNIMDITDCIKRTIALLTVQVFTYYIWHERNSRRHNKGILTPHSLLDGILTHVRAKL
ncbi:uncharacterized protein LOC141695985 [Apium graveolens]|uniref:uncharacterized protein LOC141695985 n=1 Tax=Apium graveolens TaxID=4045 RepID=UPI003D7A6BF0